MKKEAFHVGNSKKSALKRSFVHYFWLGTRPNSKLENSNFSSFKNFEFFEFRVFRVWRKTEFFEFRVTRVLEISSFSSFESNSKLEISSYFEFFRNSSLALTTLVGLLCQIKYCTQWAVLVDNLVKFWGQFHKDSGILLTLRGNLNEVTRVILLTQW